MAAPANDLLTNAQVLLPLTTQVSGDNTDAMIESGEVRGQGGTSKYFTADFTVWYRWTAPSSASASFSVTDESVNYVVTIWQAKSGVMDPVTAFADLDIVASGDGDTDPVTFTPVAGRMYYVQYAGFNFASSGPFTLHYPSPVYPFTSGIAARNGTTSHTIPFGFTSTSGSLLCVVVFGGVTHSATGWTEQLSPVSSGELSVFTKTSAGDSSITVTHNASNYPVEWAAYEFPAGSTYTAGDSNNASSETFPGLSGLPGTEQLIIAARGRIAGGSETDATTVWTAPWVESVDLFTAASGTDGCHLTIGHQAGYTSTSVTPAATTTYSGTWGVGDREKAVFAIEVAAPGGGPITGDAALAVTATLAAGATSAKPAAAALSATATLAAGALGTRPAAAARTVTATLTAGAAVAKPASAALSVTATLATSATSTKPAAAALAVTATLAASSFAASTTAAAALSVTATLAAAAVPTRVAAAALSATATLTAASTSAKPSAAALSVTATLATAADVGTPPVLAAAALAVTATLTTAAARTAIASATLNATATLTAGATRTQLAQAALAVTAALNAGAPLTTQVAAALAILATLTASLNAQGSITYRPFTGTTSRPNQGITLRP